MAGWSVIPAVSYPYGRTSGTKGEISEMSGIRRLEEPNYGEKQTMKQEGESMLPNQYQWFNESLQNIGMEEQGLRSSMTQYFIQNHGKAPDQDTQKGWNKSIMELEKKKMQVRSLEGTFKSNFAKYNAMTGEAARQSPNSSLGRIATIDANGVPLMIKGEKGNGQVGPLTEEELMKQMDSVPGMSTFDSPIQTESNYSGMFDKHLMETLDKAAKSRVISGYEEDDEGKTLRTLTESDNLQNVMSAAAQVVNTMPAKASADLRSMFYEHVMQGGIDPNTKNFVMDFYIPGRDKHGNPSIVDHGYEFDADESRVLQKYLSGKELDNSDMKIMKRAYNDFGVNMVMSSVPTKLDIVEGNKNLKKPTDGSSSGKGGVSLKPWSQFFYHQEASDYTNLSMIKNEGKGLIGQDIHDITWQGWLKDKVEPEANKEWQKTYKTEFAAAKGNDAEKDGYARGKANAAYENYIEKYKTDFYKRVGGDPMVRSRMTIPAYVIPEKSFLESGFKGADARDMKYWPINSDALSTLDRTNWSTHTPMIFNVSRGYSVDQLFGDKNTTMVRAETLVHKEDLKNIFMIDADGKKLSYQDLLDKKPSAAKSWITKFDDDKINIQGKLAKVLPGATVDKSSKASILEEISADASSWYRVILYVSDDGVVNAAMGSEAPDTEKNKGTKNPALESIVTREQ